MDPAWVEMITPETMLMLAHSRAYVDQVRTRVDEAGSSVECLTAIDDGSEDHDLEGMGAGDRGLCPSFPLCRVLPSFLPAVRVAYLL